MTAPYYADGAVTVHHGDCLDVLRQMPDNSVDSVVTDPPYGLEFMGKEWDSPGRMLGGFQTQGRERTGKGDGFGRYAAGKKRPQHSDGNMRAFQHWCEQWAAECLRVLRPGGHMLAFGGTRTWHRLACAVEDAGFEVRDSIAWLYASGFPKSLDVGKAIDKRPGVARHPEFARHLAERREAKGLTRAQISGAVVGTPSGACWNWEHHQFPEAKWWPALRDLLGMDEAKWGPVIAEAERRRIGTSPHSAARSAAGWLGAMSKPEGERNVTAPATPAAQQWQGWGTALKPAHEPIVVARKPLSGTVAANVLAYGTGALNIGACRVEGAVPHTQGGMTSGGIMAGSTGERRAPFVPDTAGRWPR